MASIILPITSARQLQQQFKEYDRDYYPYGVYERLIEMFEETYHVRKRFPYATRTTAFSGRCYHVGVFYNKQASPDLCEALLGYRYDHYDDIFIRAQTAANKTLSRYHMSPPGFPTSYYLSSRDNAYYDRLRAIIVNHARPHRLQNPHHHPCQP